MSRSIRGSKSAGWEWWSKRPLSATLTNNKKNKQICHQVERAIQKRELRKELP